MKNIFLKGLLVSISFSISPVYASLVSVSGDLQLITAPVSLNPGVLESSTTMQVFAESQGYMLQSALMVDTLYATGNSGVIAAGRSVNTYFVHMDPVGDSLEINDIVSLSGTLTFDRQILGLIWSSDVCSLCPVSDNNLDASDFFGSDNTVYPLGDLGRGYEQDAYYEGRTLDFISISPDGMSLTLTANSYPLRLDQMRVITTVPVPAAGWLFLSALISLSVSKKVRKFKDHH
ncbi:hypothetical protein [Oceanicoccus sp. KOV_DT_Chl]|uniref:hypothetical protein n=1 Tax=Oceanicoccus sp. KOV_DT_Chl TaxID=1904639 RepID=UPI0011AF0FBA|nr:hypothetical protein [Oceanicoccus sp. KOV_DT_Chl]